MICLYQGLDLYFHAQKDDRTGHLKVKIWHQNKPFKRRKLTYLSLLPLYLNSWNVPRVHHLRLSVKKQEIESDPHLMCFIFIINWIYICEGSSHSNRTSHFLLVFSLEGWHFGVYALWKSTGHRRVFEYFLPLRVQCFKK